MNNIFTSVATSACLSFAISGIMSRNARVGLISAGLAALASLIGSIAGPRLLDKFTNYSDKVNLATLANYKLVILGIFHMIGRHQKAYQIQFFASAFFTLLYSIWSKSAEVKINKNGPVFIFV